MAGKLLTARDRGSGNPAARRVAAVLLLLLLPLWLGAWRTVSGDTINPRVVQRIKDGKTTKHEILAWFGQPREVDRTPDGMVYTYKSFKDAPAMPYHHDKRQVSEQSTTPYALDPDHKIKKVPLKTEGKILKSTLTVRFKVDGETVLTHDYQEH